MTSYERSEVLRRLDINEAFLTSLERESIIHVDVEGQRYSTRMFERVRVAHSLTYELEVNLSGVAVILRLREELGGTRGALRRLEAILHHHIQSRRSDPHANHDL